MNTDSKAGACRRNSSTAVLPYRFYIEYSSPVVGAYVGGRVQFVDRNLVSANRRAFMESSSVVKVSLPWMPGELPLSIAR